MKRANLLGSILVVYLESSYLSDLVEATDEVKIKLYEKISRRRTKLRYYKSVG